MTVNCEFDESDRFQDFVEPGAPARSRLASVVPFCMNSRRMPLLIFTGVVEAINVVPVKVSEWHDPHAVGTSRST